MVTLVLPLCSTFLLSMVLDGMMPSLTVRAVPIRPITSGAAESWLISPSKAQFDTVPPNVKFATQTSPMTSVEGSVGITTDVGSPCAML